MAALRLALKLTGILALAWAAPVSVGLAQPAGPVENAPPQAAAPAPEAPPPAPKRAAPPADEVDAASDQPPAKSLVPAKRIKRTAAILQALDKVTAETLRFEADINQPVRYKDLVFTVHACEDSAPDEAETGSYANLEIDSQPKPPPGQTAPPARQLFLGWMFSNAPGAHAFQHPVYDAWLIACKTVAPAPVAGSK